MNNFYPKDEVFRRVQGDKPQATRRPNIRGRINRMSPDEAVAHRRRLKDYKFRDGRLQK